MDRVRAEMPEDLPQRPRGWQLGVVGVVAIALYVVISKGLLGEVRPQQVGDVRTIVGAITCELLVVGVFWTLRSPSPSLALRAATTAIICVPVICMVAFFSFFGDLPAGYAWERLPGSMHLQWLALVFLWSLVLAVFLPLAHRIVDALRRRSARREVSKRLQRITG